MAEEAHTDQSLAGRYATAAFDLAREQNSVDAMERDLIALRDLVGQSPDLALLVRAPVFSRDEQAKGIDAILRRMEAAPLTVRFVLTLVLKGRLFALLDIIKAFLHLVAQQRGEVNAEVTSARPLSDAEVTELKAVLKSKLGREPRLETKLDASLLGGLVVKVGSRMIDSSLRTKLNGMRVAMRGH